MLTNCINRMPMRDKQADDLISLNCMDGPRHDEIRLALSQGVGPRTMNLLFEQLGTASTILSTSHQRLSAIPGIGPGLIKSISNASTQVPLGAILAWCERNSVELLLHGDADYPYLLGEIEDAPRLLFCRGQFQRDDQNAVAIVGTRRPTPYGLQQAMRFASELANAGITVVSGLARGVDGAAHKACIKSGGRTIAVLGSGLGVIYPPEHRILADQIANQGVVVSEYSPHSKPQRGMFPQRNRLISGLASATLVIEAPERSGSLITTRLAMEQNREVMAVPGPVSSPLSRGCNKLISDGAKLVQSVDDILEELQPLTGFENHETEPLSDLDHPSFLNESERKIYEAVAPDGSLIDEIIQRTRYASHEVIAAVNLLELRHVLIRSDHQKIYRSTTPP
nr:DNA-processing protein DprA [Rhodopirellula sp.]